MSFWKYLLINTKFWLWFFVIAQIFIFVANWISSLEKSDWWATEGGLALVSLIILIGDYIAWKRLK